MRCPVWACQCRMEPLTNCGAPRAEGLAQQDRQKNQSALLPFLFRDARLGSGHLSESRDLYFRPHSPIRERSAGEEVENDPNHLLNVQASVLRIGVSVLPTQNSTNSLQGSEVDNGVRHGGPPRLGCELQKRERAGDGYVEPILI